MNSIKSVGLLILLLTTTTASAQFLEKLGKKAERAVERTVERRVEKETEKSTDRALDSVIDAPKKNKKAEKKTKKEKKEKKVKKEKSNKVVIGSSSGYSGDCSKFYPFSEGSSGQITSYEGNNKVAAVMDYTITNVRNDMGKEIATINSVVKDKKGEVLFETDYDYSCSDGVLSIDFESMMNSKMFDQFKDFEYEMNGENLNLPNNLSVGDELPDASVEMDINMSGINMDMKTTITDRKVVGTETVTTPAGTFPCFVITYTINVDMSMGMNQTNSAKQWISEGVGMVKQEDYNKNGKITSSSMLTDFNR
tara:strand:+ start:4536 stop:5462 length:927 start_codon:yes stop_codon:yes gene_type:complete